MRCHKGRTAVHWAAEGKGLSVLHWIQTEYPLLMTQVDQQKQTALHVAVQFGKIENVLFLFSQVKTNDCKGRTPLHIAAIAGQTKTAGLLMNLGADPFELTPEGENCLHLCSEQGHFDLLQYVIKNTRQRNSY